MSGGLTDIPESHSRDLHNKGNKEQCHGELVPWHCIAICCSNHFVWHNKQRDSAVMTSACYVSSVIFLPTGHRWL